MKRRDWFILAAVLAVSALLFLLRPTADMAAGTDAYLRITAPDQTFALVPLDGDREIVIEQPDGERNVVQVFKGGFRMKEANCKNQDCIHQGDVTLTNIAGRVLANQIICLPHQVVLELVTADGTAPDTAP